MGYNKNMRLILETIIRQPDGIIDVSVIIKGDNKKKRSYTYHLDSAYVLMEFNKLYYANTKCHGKALQILVKNNVSITAEKQ